MKTFAVIDVAYDHVFVSKKYKTSNGAIIAASYRWNRLSEESQSDRDIFGVFYGNVDSTGWFDLNNATCIKSFI